MPESAYVVVWEFKVRPGCEAEFAVAYGAEGPWAMLFQRSLEFRRVELVRSEQDPLRFFTFDHWESEEGFAAFRAAHRTAYETLDRRLSGLTEWERRIGDFRWAGD